MWVRAGDLLDAALDLDGSSYDPIYESPIKDASAWHLVKHLDQDVAFEKQVEVGTTWGGFVISSHLLDVLATFLFTQETGETSAGGKAHLGFHADDVIIEAGRRQKADDESEETGGTA